MISSVAYEKEHRQEVEEWKQYYRGRHGFSKYPALWSLFYSYERLARSDGATTTAT